MPYEEGQRDFNLKYETTYVAHTKDGVNRPMWVNSVDEEGYVNGKILLRTKGPEEQRTFWRETAGNYNIEEDEDFILDFPRLGAINLTHAPIIIRRMAKRQWRKVLTASVIQMHDPFNEERHKYKLPIITQIENDSILFSLFNPTYPSREEAWEELMSGEKLGVAITPEWFLGIKAHAEGVKLFKDDISVGTVIGQSTVVLYPEADLLKEQVISLGYKVEAAV